MACLLGSCYKNPTDGLFKEARKLDSLKKYTEAIAVYDKILTIDENNIHALFDRAVDKGLVTDHEGEVADLMRILKLDSTNTLALYNLGVTLGNLTRYKESINAFNKAVQTKGGEVLTMDYEPNSFVDENYHMNDVSIADIKLERGIVYYKADSVRKAYFDLTYCIENNHQLKDSYYFRALTYLKSDMQIQACEDLKLAELHGEKDATELRGRYCR
jgi:tetratricopeptide (TPR) repeat protein